MAAPHVSGVAALILSRHPTFAPEQVRQALRVGSSDIGAAGFDADTGYGVAQAPASIAIADPLEVLITSPGAGTLAPLPGTATTSIEGIARGAQLVSWELQAGKSTDAGIVFSPLASGTTNVSGTLKASQALIDGEWTLRLRASNASGQVFEDRQNVRVDNVVISNPPPRATNSSAPFQKVGDVIEIKGTVTPHGFTKYRIEIAHNGTLQPAPSLANGGTVTVVNGVIATWNTAGLESGDYNIHLIAESTTSGEIHESVDLVLLDTANDFPLHLPYYGWSEAYNILTPADINGDGKTDMVIAFRDRLYVIDVEKRAVISGWPQQLDPSELGASADPTIGDLDGDGQPEIVISADNFFYIFDSTGVLKRKWGKTQSKCAIAISDIDGDGMNELVASMGTAMQVVDINGQSKPGWPQQKPAAWETYDGFAPAVADVDGDGKQEIFVEWFNGIVNKRQLALYHSDGTYVSGWPIDVDAPAVSRTFQPVFADINRDGRLDIVTLTNGGSVLVLDANGATLEGWPQQMGDPSGPLQRARSVSGASVGDLNGDGQFEIVATMSDGTGLVSTYVWNHRGEVLPGWPIQSKGNAATMYSANRTAILADINGDGRAEIIRMSGASNTGRFSVQALEAIQLDGSMLPGFPKAIRKIRNWSASMPAVADFDGDGKLELAFADSVAIIYLWNLDQSNTTYQPWPMSRRNAQHTSAIESAPLPSLPDLRSESLAGPATATTGTTIEIHSSIRNNGAATNAAFLVGFYISTDETITSNDILIGSGSIPLLKQGETNTATHLLALPAVLSSGNYFIGMIADYNNQLTEADESNNVKLGGTLAIQIGPDFQAVSIEGPSTLVRGQPASVMAKIANIGTGSTSGAGFIYLSTDATITTSDLRLRWIGIPSIPAGASADVTAANIVVGSSIPPGTYYWGLIVDRYMKITERDETNNIIAGNLVVIQ